jgi:hypothetical protein
MIWLKALAAIATSIAVCGLVIYLVIHFDLSGGDDRVP